MFNEHLLVTQRNRQMQVARNLGGKIHPRRKDIMEERLHNIKQDRVATREGRIEVAVIALLLQKDVAEMGVTMSDHSHGGARRIEYDLCALDELSQRIVFTCDTRSIDRPAIAQKFVKGNALLFAW